MRWYFGISHLYVFPKLARDPPRSPEQEVITKIVPEEEGTMLLIDMGPRLGRIVTLATRLLVDCHVEHGVQSGTIWSESL
jgi:hypothetical protein